MKKPLFATLLGGFLGIFDGLTALFTPEVRDQIGGIVIGSTIKGLATGILIGLFARKVHSLALGTVFGLIVGAGFAYLILLMNPGHPLNITEPVKNCSARIPSLTLGSKARYQVSRSAA